MKKLRKILSLVLVLSLALSCGMVSAANTAEEDYEVVYSDENVTILAYTYEITGKTRGLGIDGVYTADPRNSHLTNCVAVNGNKCVVNLENVDSTHTLEYTLNFNIQNGPQPCNFNEQLSPGLGRYYTYTNNTNTGLVGTVVTDVEAVNASTVDYFYTITQTNG